MSRKREWRVMGSLPKSDISLRDTGVVLWSLHLNISHLSLRGQGPLTLRTRERRRARWTGTGSLHIRTLLRNRIEGNGYTPNTQNLDSQDPNLRTKLCACNPRRLGLRRSEQAQVQVGADGAYPRVVTANPAKPTTSPWRALSSIGRVVVVVAIASLPAKESRCS